jgi:hypothetical protein
MALKYLVDINLGGNEIQNFAVQTLSTAPTTDLVVGRLYYDSAAAGLFVHNGTGFSRVGLTADGTTITESNGTISVADNSHTHTMGNITGLASALAAKVDDSQVLTDVPLNAVFTDTTYSAGNGISLSGTTFSVAGGDGLTQEASGLKVDGTVVRTSGDQTIAGNKTFSNNIVVSGNLTVSGTTTTVNSTQVTLADNILTLASNANAPEEVVTAGIEVNRGEGENKPSVFYSEGDGRWFFSTSDGQEHPISLPGEFNTNTQRSNEDIRDVVAAQLVGGTNVTITEDDAANTLTVSSVNTTYSAGDGLGLNGTTFSNAYAVDFFDGVEGRGQFESITLAEVNPLTAAVQVKEVDGNELVNVITDWRIAQDGTLSIYLTNGKIYSITVHGLRA